LSVLSPAKTCVYSSKFLASCIHKLEFEFTWSKFSWMETWMQNLINYPVYKHLKTNTVTLICSKIHTYCFYDNDCYY
jgi:hypothetical protein